MGAINLGGQSTYHRTQRDNTEKRINCGICLYPSTLNTLEKYRGEYSRSGLIETILLDFFEAMEELSKDEDTKGD